MMQFLQLHHLCPLRQQQKPVLLITDILTKRQYQYFRQPSGRAHPPIHLLQRQIDPRTTNLVRPHIQLDHARAD
ncbi:hypothetical protein, partial [Achromobacter sp. GbtcB20]|uniref:hypothetical protein n=1 Tax=Achromobacter sp. GbtcB20 TaxID=2824765 RepID=UPI001C2F9B39